MDIASIADPDGLENVAFAYQWQAYDADINGATGATYTLIDSEEGKTIKVQVSFTDDEGNNETLTSVATAAVTAEPVPNNPATGAPTISGTAQVGETLTANTSGVADADGLENVSFSYQWFADDAEIAGATGLTYTLSADDEGRTVKVKVSFTDNAGNEETADQRGDGCGGGGATLGAARQAHRPLHHGDPRLCDPHLERPRRRLHHRLRDPQARPRERCRGRVQ